MITEIVLFELPAGISREELLAKYRRTAPAWSQNPDLVRKYYFFDPAQSVGGGIYVWKDKAAALRWHGAEYRERIRTLYGREPQMTYFDTVLTVDNTLGQVREHMPA